MSHTQYTPAEAAIVAAALAVAVEQQIAAVLIPMPGEPKRFVAFGEMSELRTLVRDEREQRFIEDCSRMAGLMVNGDELAAWANRLLTAEPSAQQAAGSIDTGELRRLAEAATPGYWTYWPTTEERDAEIAAPCGVRVANLLQGDVTKDNSAFIAAANPAAILRLLDALATAAIAQPIAVSAPTDERAALESSELYRMQMAAISTAAIGYCMFDPAMLPEYVTPALRDVQSLYAKYAALHAAALQPAQDGEHDLYTDADQNRPDVICDSNGQVVLGLCKKCGKGECELVERCAARAAAPVSGPSDLHAAIMNLIPSVEPVVFASWTVAERDAFKLGHKYARHDAAELVSAAPVSGQGASELPPLPDSIYLSDVPMDAELHTSEQLIAYGDARALHERRKAARDSRPRSEDSRAEVSDEDILQMFATCVGNERDDARQVYVSAEQVIDFVRCWIMPALASTTPQKADNE